MLQLASQNCACYLNCEHNGKRKKVNTEADLKTCMTVLGPNQSPIDLPSITPMLAAAQCGHNACFAANFSHV